GRASATKICRRSIDRIPRANFLQFLNPSGPPARRNIDLAKERPSLVGTEDQCRVSAGWPRSHTATRLNPLFIELEEIADLQDIVEMGPNWIFLSRSSSGSIRSSTQPRGTKISTPRTRPHRICIAFQKPVFAKTRM